jgi:hypothetical protein
MAGMNNHNHRLNNVMNADKDLSYLNTHYSAFQIDDQRGDLRTDIEGHIYTNDVKTKKNSVLAIEHLMTFSPDFIAFEKKKLEGDKYTLSGDVKKWNEFKESSINWLKDKYGKDNIVNISVHYDERTPHIHAYVVPIKEKTVKWKNKNGEGEKTVKSLCARDYLGGKEKMQEMQDSFHSAVSHLGLERGVKGSLAKHEHIQKYYERVNQSVAFQADIDKFKPFTQAIELSDPPLFGKAEWKATEETKIENLVKQQQIETIQDFKRAFEGDFERMLESKKKTSDLKRELGSISNELSKKVDELVKTKLIAQNSSKNATQWRDFSNKIQNAAVSAVLNKDPKAIQIIMNLHDKALEQQKDKGKNNEMQR